jgi:Polymorphic toxin system, DSP-PTPase phosphatase
MIQIEPHLLWLGHAGDCRDVAKVLDAGIRAVVQLAIEEPPAQFPREVIFVRIPLHDGSDNSADDLRLAINTVEQLLSSKIPMLLCCGAGMSRSPAIAACALARIYGQSPTECLQQIQGLQGTDVSVTLWQDLLTCLSH